MLEPKRLLPAAPSPCCYLTRSPVVFLPCSILATNWAISNKHSVYIDDVGLVFALRNEIRAATNTLCGFMRIPALK